MRYLKILLGTLLMLVTISCGSDNKGTTASTSTGTDTENDDNDDSSNSRDTTPPVLKNLMFDFGTMTDGDRGDFVFTAMGQGQAPFVAFGTQVSGNPYTGWDFYLPLGTDIMSPIDGVVSYVTHNDNWDDWEIGISPVANSLYVLIFDHVDNPLAAGTTVTANQVIAQVSDNVTLGNLKRVEFELVQHSADGTTPNISHCPFTFFDPTLKNQYQNLILGLMNDYEAYAITQGYDPTISNAIYDQNSMETPGCYLDSI